MNYYNEIKNELINNEVNKKVKDYSKNRSDLNAYYNVVKLLVEAQGGEDRVKYGNKIIKEYALKLTKELGKGYSSTNLKYMRQFYLFCRKGQPMVDQLTWSHYTILLSLNENKKINYYINQTIKYNLSKRELKIKIKNNEYERLDDKTKDKLVNNGELLPQDFIKNPILIKNSYDYTDISEKILKKLILEALDNFLTELGDGFTYIKMNIKSNLAIDITI